MIGKQHLLTMLFFALVAGALATAMLWQLGSPGRPLSIIGNLLPADMVTSEGAILPETYNTRARWSSTVSPQKDFSLGSGTSS